MHIWTAINVEEQLTELKSKIKEIEKQVGIIDSVVNLPLHISLKISFAIGDDLYEKAVALLQNYYKSLSPFDVDIDKIEREGSIIWIRIKESDTLTGIHNDLDKLVLENLGIPPHKFDLEYKFHITLFMDGSDNKISSAYNLIKGAALPKKLCASHMVIGSSKTGAAGTYHVDKNIEI